MYDADELRAQWEKATHELPWGVHRAFKDVLGLVQEEKKKDLVYGADYTAKGACLVNASANMLVVGGGHGIPMAKFHDVVSLFDRINKFLEEQGVNHTPNIVSPLAAEILLNWYGPEATHDVVEEVKTSEDNIVHLPYVERTDEEMEEAFMSLLENRPVETPFDVLEPLDGATSEAVARQE